MKTYLAYTYSRLVAVISGLIYLFIGIVIIGLQIGMYPNIRARYVLLELMAAIAITYVLSKLTAKGKVAIELKDDILTIKWRQQMAFHAEPDRSILFNDIKHYKATNSGLNGNILRIALNNGIKYRLYEHLLPWISINDFSEFVIHFVHEYNSAKVIGFPKTDASIQLPNTPLTSTPIPISADINTEIVTHRKIGIFILISVVSLFYWGYLGILFTAMFIDEHDYPVLCFSVLGYFMGFFNYYRYFQNAPKVRVDKDKITFNRKEIYHWDEVENIQFSGKQPFKYIGSYPMQGLMIRFKNGKERYMFDSMYTNLWEVKSFMRGVMLTKKEYAEWAQEGVVNAAAPPSEKQPISEQPKYSGPLKDLQKQYFIYFKGEQFSSLNAYLLWPALCLDVWGMIEINDAAATILLSIAGFLWFLLFSWGMNYFGVSEQYLIVKNQNLFWRKQLYSFADIEEIRLDSPGNSSYTLNVVLKNFKEKAYTGATLSRRDWFALKTNLESKGVKIKDENYFTELQSKGMKKAYRLLILYMVVYVVIAIGASVFIGVMHLPPRTEIILKILWILLVFLGALGLRRVIVKLSKMADKIDNDGKTE